MKRLNVFCEGPTEHGFCFQVLQPHLFPRGDGIVLTLAVEDKDSHHVYGIGRRSYNKVRKFIVNTIKHRSGTNVWFTSLFALYALPIDFPEIDPNRRNPADPMPYVLELEAAFGADIDNLRFLPHLQLHEYETILFADPDAFAISFDNCTNAVQKLKQIVASFPSIEHIDDGRQSAPSKRIIQQIPEYDGRKASAGPDIAEYIGLSAIRSKCPHFDSWLTRLENLSWE